MNTSSNAHIMPSLPFQDSKVFEYLKMLLTDVGVENTKKDIEEKMISDLYQRLNFYITSTLLQKLPSRLQSQFLQLTETENSQEEIDIFLKQHIPHIEEVMAQAFLEFRNLYLYGNT